MKYTLTILNYQDGHNYAAHEYDAGNPPTKAGPKIADFVDGGTEIMDIGGVQIKVKKFYIDIQDGFIGTILDNGVLLSDADAGIWIGPGDNKSVPDASIGTDELKDQAVTPEKTSFIE